MPRPCRSTGTLPAACTASQCTSAPRLAREAHDVGDRLQHAGLVVGEHHRHQRGLAEAGELALQGGEIEHALAVDRHDVGLGHGPLHALMLDGRDQHAPAAGAGQRHVVGLGAARGEDRLPPAGRRPAPPPGGAPCRPGRAPCGRRDAPTTDCRPRATPRPWRRTPPAAAGWWRCGRDTTDAADIERASSWRRPSRSRNWPAAGASAMRGARLALEHVEQGDRAQEQHGSGCPAPPTGRASGTCCGRRGSRSAPISVQRVALIGSSTARMISETRVSAEPRARR